MTVDVFIDKLTPCLEETATGKIVKTVFSLARHNELSGLKEQGWMFDWVSAELETAIIYKLTLKNDDAIQGLSAIGIDKSQYAIHIKMVESAPHNKKANGKKYKGVGGHLFAIAIKLSAELGFGGFVYMDAKNMDLVKHYTETLNAVRVKTRIHEYRMAILENEAQHIINKYTLEGDLNVD
ncbi:MAG: hypothetical protein LBR54_02770 [Oscillospiraceae bacterium]|nr:hypothetical protein [Oscillospiraceae bacterium]